MTTVPAPKVGEVFAATGDSERGVRLPEADGAYALELFLESGGLRLADLSAEERSRAEALLLFAPLHSVVQRDLDLLGEDADSGWHADGSGRRSVPTWWAMLGWDEFVAGVADRIVAACHHEFERHGRCTNCHATPAQVERLARAA